ncbi:MAG: hypothetical protein EBU08_02630 [Micrococcales bacterium]|nr:hypothetical protein [Micrococcales bacterium]
MRQIEDNISLLVQNHFPDFYKEDGQVFVEFVKEYYNWAQESNNHLFFSRNLLEYRDIDSTIDKFLVHYKNKYLADAPVFYDKTRSNVKHSLDFYRSKGTERGTKLVFQEVWGLSDVEIYFPGKDLLKASDGEWYVPVYLEVDLSEKTKTFIGKQIYGSASGATAFVEGVGRKAVKGKHFDVLFLTGKKGNFVLGDLITVDGSLSESPSVIGSLTNIEIGDSGRDFSVGDVVDVISTRLGKQGKARITSVVNSTGKVTFTLVNGGTGYRLITQPIVAEKTLLVANKTSSNAYITDFSVDEIVIQPLANVTFNTSNAYFALGSLFTGSNSIADVATGRVLGNSQKDITGTATANTTSAIVVGTGTSFDTQLSTSDYIRFRSCTSIFQVSSVTNATHLTLSANGPSVVANSITMANGFVNLIVTSGSFALADRIKNTTGLISSYVDTSATGVMIGSNSGAIGLTSVSNTFSSNGYNFIYGQTSNVYANVTQVGTGSGANVSIGSLTDSEIVYLNSDLIGSNNAIANAILTGTASSNTTSPQVNGVGTLFTNEMYRGAYIKFTSNNTVFQVNSVTNNTVLILTANGPAASANTINIKPGPYRTLPLTSLKFGFPKLQTGNSSTILNLVLTRGSFEIGTIASLTGINPGSNYNINPIVLTRDSAIAGFNRRDLHLEVSNTTGTFVIGEEVTQNFSTPSYTFSMSGANTGFTVLETVTQQTGPSTNAYGEVRSSNTTVAVLYTTSGNFINSSIGATLSGSGFINVKRKTFNQSFTPLVQLTGTFSGATTDVGTVTQIANSSLMGNNAIISTFAGVVNGSIGTLSVIDSGYAYEDGEDVTLSLDSNPYVATGFANLINQGTGEGYFRSTKGFLNSDKYLHDGRFYQAYSYQVKASVSLNVFGDTLKKLCHVAGTELFGNVLKTSDVDVSITSTGVQIET